MYSNKKFVHQVGKKKDYHDEANNRFSQFCERT